MMDCDIRMQCSICKRHFTDEHIRYSYDGEQGFYICHECAEKEQWKQDEGIKHDTDKPRYDLVPPDALAEVVTIFTYGSNKYQPRNWEKGMSWGRCFGAAMRHLWAFWRGEDRDPESGHLHLAHAATNCLFLLSYYLRKIGEDDRQR